MNDMLKDKDFWLPILKYVGGAAAYFGILWLLPATAAMVVTISVLVLFMGYIAYMIGKSSYDLRQYKAKSDYLKLTGKELDEGK